MEENKVIIEVTHNPSFNRFDVWCIDEAHNTKTLLLSQTYEEVMQQLREMAANTLRDMAMLEQIKTNLV